jgi:hypothetical protein
LKNGSQFDILKMYPMVSNYRMLARVRHAVKTTGPIYKNMKINEKENEWLISRRELGARWSCSRETLKRRERAGILPVYKLGKGVRYKLHDVEAVEKAALVNKG